MPTVIGYHDVKDKDHWLASPKREEFFGPLGVTNIRTFVDLKGVKTPIRRRCVDSAVCSGPLLVRGGFRAVCGSASVRLRLGVAAVS